MEWQKLMPPKGFVVLPRRWVVERTIAWIDQQQEDEQGLREVVCERRGVGICCHDSPHDEAARPCLRTFHTASEYEFSEVRLKRILRSSKPPMHLAARS